MSLNKRKQGEAASVPGFTMLCVSSPGPGWRLPKRSCELPLSFFQRILFAIRAAAGDGREIQSAFSTRTRIIREKWVIIVRTRSPRLSLPLPLSPAMLGLIGSARRVFTHIRAREEKKKKLSFRLKNKNKTITTFTMKSHSRNRHGP